MILKKPLFLLILMISCLNESVTANNGPRVITGELIGKNGSGLLLKLNKSKQEEINVHEIGSIMVLDGKKLIDGWRNATIGGAGAGLGISVIEGNSINPRHITRSSKLIGLGAILGALSRISYNFFTQKGPILVFDHNRAGDTVELIQRLPIGTKIRMAYKNHH